MSTSKAEGMIRDEMLRRLLADPRLRRETRTKHGVLDSSNVFEVVRVGQMVRFRMPTWPRVVWKVPVRMGLSLGLWLVAICDPERKEFDRRWEEISR